ncbi:hypothetical protein PCANC_03872 [Puccinia coronata f. sp. avenae]|uniref:Uncharacterized protein n=1 Tax=Puccinia coronata f. sp. avenae TaxID=200324 RepID=A0A2N5W1G9_9BASI|nr:hypothetical protein PCANC_03872 [Puccinia coronata f. sp. avenae]
MPCATVPCAVRRGKLSHPPVLASTHARIHPVNNSTLTYSHSHSHSHSYSCSSHNRFSSGRKFCAPGASRYTH